MGLDKKVMRASILSIALNSTRLLSSVLIAIDQTSACKFPTFMPYAREKWHLLDIFSKHHINSFNSTGGWGAKKREREKKKKKKKKKKSSIIPYLLVDKAIGRNISN